MIIRRSPVATLYIVLDAQPEKQDSAMRVVAGKFRSRQLATFSGSAVRPTSDRLRETLFDVLAAQRALEGTRWLDLFAGTGAVGIEALSRGAREVYFVESSSAAAQAIHKNLQSLNIKNGSKV